MNLIADNLERLRARLAFACARSGRDPTSVLIIGAAKQVEASRVALALAAGLQHVGENYMQEGLAKIEALGGAATWHFIGHLQTKKARQVVERFAFVHSLDRPELLDELEKRAAARQCEVQALIEVNLAGEATKTGCAPAEVEALVQQTLSRPHIQLVGLMTMPPPSAPEVARPYFRQLRELRDELQARHRVNLPHLSMGMTGDYEVAIEEGATMVRIGTGLFGPRSA